MNILLLLALAFFCLAVGFVLGVAFGDWAKKLVRLNRPDATDLGDR